MGILQALIDRKACLRPLPMSDSCLLLISSSLKLINYRFLQFTLNKSINRKLASFYRQTMNMLYFSHCQDTKINFFKNIGFLIQNNYFGFLFNNNLKCV